MKGTACIFVGKNTWICLLHYPEYYTGVRSVSGLHRVHIDYIILGIINTLYIYSSGYGKIYQYELMVDMEIRVGGIWSTLIFNT